LGNSYTILKNKQTLYSFMAESDDERKRIREQKRKELREQAETGEVATERAPEEPVEIDGQDHFQRVVSESDTVLVDCYADWCGPCQMMEPTIEAVAAESEAAVAKVDVDRHQQLASQLGVRGVPTLLLYVDGEAAERLVGAQDRETLDRLLQQAG
jgi:thioredoxin 1